MSAYFDKINDDGGVNGRKIKLVSLDDAFSPPKAVEQTRKLVEGDEVLLIAGSLGTATGIATQKYLNGREVPQLLVQSGSSAFNNPGHSPVIARPSQLRHRSTRIQPIHPVDDAGSKNRGVDLE